MNPTFPRGALALALAAAAGAVMLTGVSDGQIGNAPIDIGNRQPQQISVIGLTKCPVHTPGPPAEAGRAKPTAPTIASNSSTAANSNGSK